MRHFRALWARLRGMFGGELADRELSAELESHLQMHMDDNVRSGMSPDQARRDALIKLGGVEQARQIVGQGTKLALIGVVTGSVAALISTRLLASLLFGVKTTDPATYISVIVVLFLVTFAACYYPARRAMHVDPMQALRTE